MLSRRKLPSPKDLGRLREALTPENAGFLVASERLISARGTLDRAERAIEEMNEKRLVIGLLGGTGVGKSSLTNALAEREISRAGDRRPTTDRAVCYRHQDFSVPDWLEEDDLAPSPDGHDLPALRGVILIDLPDIDSRARRHRDRVHRILPRLDLLLVVASVDKYADRALYDEINALPQAPKNWVFLLNAIDKLAPSDRTAVAEDFAQKLHKYAGVSDPTVLTLSAKEALAGGDRRASSGIDAVHNLLESLGEDAKRRAVLLANAEGYLKQLSTDVERTFPADELAEWRQELEPLITPLTSATRAHAGAFQDDLQDAIGPWLSDRALRASSFPVGWIHFLLRRYWPGRRGGRVADPFRGASDPGAPYAEDLLLRPLRLAQHEAQALARQQGERFRLSIPAKLPTESHASGTALGEWTQHLRDLAPKLGWRFRQHAIPFVLLLITLAWVVAPIFSAGSDAWLKESWQAMWGLIARLDPVTWASVLIALGLYYLLLYPYFLHRLELRVDQEAQEGVERYLDHWQSEHRAAWQEPLAQQVSEWDAWFKQLQAARKTLPPPSLETTSLETPVSDPRVTLEGHES